VSLSKRRFDRAATVAGMLAGDSHARASFYDHYRAMVNRLVWRLLGADSEHDDVVQMVFVHALTSIGKLRDPESLDTWLGGRRLKSSPRGWRIVLSRNAPSTT